MIPYDHQIKISKEAFKILKEHYLVYLAMEERTGKSLTAILIMEQTKLNKILIITKKKAISGWEDTIKGYQPKKEYDVINYESLHKVNPKDYDAVILDEAHANLAAFPKVSVRWKKVAEFTRKKALVYCSATPSAQTYAQLFHQLHLSSWSPWKRFRSFYKWFDEYGIPKIKFLAGRQIKVYDNVINERVLDDVKHLFISYTRQELGFEHEPNDIIHYVHLSKPTIKMYNELMNDKVLSSLGIVADTTMSLRTKLHQLEGGTIKYEEESHILGNTEKIEYIKKEFGDSSSVVIFYHYKSELPKLQKAFRKCRILQATSFAEGVDLSKYKTLVIYSMDFSTARYTQRRARQCNMQRGEPIDVHYILTKDGISEQVYKTVAVNKTNYVDSYFVRKTL